MEEYFVNHKVIWVICKDCTSDKCGICFERLPMIAVDCCQNQLKNINDYMCIHCREIWSYNEFDDIDFCSLIVCYMCDKEVLYHHEKEYIKKIILKLIIIV